MDNQLTTPSTEQVLPSFSYQTQYSLDRSHFDECFTQSVTVDKTIKPYYKAIALSLFGLCLLLFTEADGYLAWFIAALGILDAVSVYYRKAWWLTRQMMSKAAGNELTLTIDNEGIKNNSFYVNSLILWADITAIEQTELGYLVKHKGGVNYLSKRVLSEDVQHFIEHYKS